MDKITDLMKFGIMILIYTGYMTWWASGVSHQLSTTTELLHEHIIADAQITTNTIALAVTVQNIQRAQEKNSEMLIQTIETHAKCSALMEAMIKRIDRLEGGK